MTPDPIQLTPSEPRQTSEGCSARVIPGLAGLYVLLASVVAQFMSWSIEQVLFDASFDIPDTRWVAALVYALALLLPLGLAYRLTASPRPRAAYQAWLAGAVVALLAVPVRWLGLVDNLAVTTVLVMILGLSTLGLFAWLKRKGTLVRAHTGGIFAALFWALALGLPWLMWGALGSPLDTLTNLLLGLLLGVFSAWILTGIILAEETAGTGFSPGRSRSMALVFFNTLVILSTGLGLSGTQWMLAFTLAPLAWAAVALTRYGSSESRPAWPAVALLLGMAAAWPLMFVDPDELALVVSSSPGDLTEWATRMTQTGFYISIAAGLLLTALASRVVETRAWRTTTAILAVLAIAGVVYIYLIPGKPGFYGERLFVVLNEQGDLSEVAAVTDYHTRRTEVYQRLVAQAETTQTGIRSALERFGLTYTPYYLVNGIEVNGGPLLRAWLESRPEVDRVLDSPRMRPLPNELPFARGEAQAPNEPQWNLTSIGAPRVWNELGVDGSGVIVGQSDSGVQGDHPELADSYRGAGGSDDYNWFDPWYGSRSPQDYGGHGTHTLGSVLGSRVGVAPGATWIGCTNMGRNLGNPALYLDCMQFMLAPFPQGGNPFTDGDPTRGAMVLNNSWGCPDREGCDNASLEPAVNALRDAGLFVVVSAGNSGYSGCGSISEPPAIYGQVYSVAALDSNGSLADFSSIGPVEVDGSLRMKPDIAAPGQGVLSAYPNGTYQIASGTSMAGPHVVGVVALMWSANPSLIGDIDRTTEILNRTARPYLGDLPECVDENTRPNAGVGYGMLDAYAAVQAALEAGQ